jgi:hypothetical protein
MLLDAQEDATRAGFDYVALFLNVGRASLEHRRDPYKRGFASFR